ncbi:MAG TPA: glycosyltransferase family 2 protein [Methylocystis sp.]|nr:glycosyltransferase family 2 protein [Methylocystis sp.]
MTEAPELSVVVPAYNEAKNLRPLLARLAPVLERSARDFEIIFVDDGSSDQTLQTLRDLAREDAHVSALSFSRNFGKEIAIAAGLDAARGAAVVIIDGDLQHPPELIAKFVEKWREGYKNVYGVRSDRETDPKMRSFLTRVFYRLLDKFGEVALPDGAGDFRLLDRQAVDALLSMRERARFNKGLFAWIGFKSIGVPFVVEARAHGVSTFNFWRLARFALDGLMSFSSMPLKIWAYVGMAVSGGALAMAAWFFVKTMIIGVDVPGYASLIVSIAFFSGVQLLSLGVLGEYVARIFAEVKGRPLYLVAERIGRPQAKG